MSGRSRHLMAILLLLLAVALVVWGCGGGEEVTTTSLTGGVTTTLPSGGSSSSADKLLDKPLATTEDTPGEYLDAVDQGRPVVLLFYVTGGTDDTKVLDSVTQLQAAFQDYVFLLYDYSAPDAYGDLSTLLKVNYPPELVLVDGVGNVKEIWNGYVDEGTLNQSLVNLGQG
jgi:hypothetical protein